MTTLAAGLEIATNLSGMRQSSVRVAADISHAIRGRDDEAARRWEEFQRGGAGAAGDAVEGVIFASPMSWVTHGRYAAVAQRRHAPARCPSR